MDNMDMTLVYQLLLVMCSAIFFTLGYLQGRQSQLLRSILDTQRIKQSQLETRKSEAAPPHIVTLLELEKRRAAITSYSFVPGMTDTERSSCLHHLIQQSEKTKYNTISKNPV